MGIKTVHIIFIFCAELLLVLFALWSFSAAAEQATGIYQAYGLVSLFSALILGFYGVSVYKKFKTIA